MAPGHGVLIRREHSLVFIPNPSERSSAVITAFGEVAHEASIFEVVGDAVVEASFDVDPFVCVSFASVIQIRVFGDVDIRTDLPSVPMLSGAGSGTWVEHSAPGSGGAITAQLSSGEPLGESTFEATDLQAGTALAGGFVLHIAGPAVASDRVTMALDALGPSPVVEPAVELDEEQTLVPAAVVEAAGPSVMARACPSGHPNRPSRVTCSVCDSFLPPGDDGVTLVQRPAVATLVFDDGVKHELANPLVIGRAPSVDASDQADGQGKTLLPMDSDRISRTHLEVSIVEWDVMVSDRGSRNGTVVVPADGAPPVKIDPSTPQLIEPGAVVYFGTRSFTLRPPGHGAALEEAVR